MPRPLGQFAFDFSPPRAPERAALAARIIAAGLAPNESVLGINRALAAPDRDGLPHPWSLPSRLFQWPVDYIPSDGDGGDRLRLRHPNLIDHPALARLRDVVPEADAWDSPAPDGHGAWHHAVDLMTPDLWPALIDTLSFTTPQNAATALAYAMHERIGGRYAEDRRNRSRLTPWTPDLARTILAALRLTESEDSLSLFLGAGLYPCRVGDRIAPNLRCEGAQAAWLVVHGLERGWLVYDRSGSLNVSETAFAAHRDAPRARPILQ